MVNGRRTVGVLAVSLLLCSFSSPACGALSFFARHDPAAAERIALLARTEAGRAELHDRLSQSLVENSAEAAAEQKEQGEGFAIKFVPANSTVYDPDQSKTFKVVPHQVIIAGVPGSCSRSRALARATCTPCSLLFFTSSELLSMQGLCCSCAVKVPQGFRIHDCRGLFCLFRISAGSL